MSYDVHGVIEQCIQPAVSGAADIRSDESGEALIAGTEKVREPRGLNSIFHSISVHQLIMVMDLMRMISEGLRQKMP